ncbi:ABC transporter substrate-binding protein [Nitratireductor thuwali]|uniref:ABC transporter substrate-binding protein YesO n=1 Tax=Nitratireductor thuwali TaxID=2267699 RepID=A0ABY5MHB9_9HYPH|nr:Putative ABC transporter substrate-binding protein YesO [Nitratireductor thuwali]
MAYRISRRSVLAGGAAALSASALGGGLAFGQETRLRLMWWGSQPRADRTFKVSNLYMEANPGVTIDGETVGWDDYWPRLATQVAGRNAPDIIQMDYRYIFEYARRDALAPLEGYVPDVLNVSDFDQAALDGGSVDGSLYGVSLGANSSAMMVNSAAFEEAGIAIPDQSLTFDEMKRIGEEITAAGKRQNFYGLSDGSGVEPFFENFVRQRGKALYTEEGELAFDAEDAREWFELWAAMRESKACVPPDLQALDKRQIETGMVSLGHAAVSYAHSNQLVGYQTINKDPIVMHAYPRIEAGAGGGHYRKPSMFFSVSSQSENPEAAAAYISFFVTNPEAAAVLDVERGVPESAAVREALKPHLDETGRAAVEYIGGLGDLAGPLPPPPPLGAGEIDKMLIRVSEEVAFEQHTPQSGAEAFVEEAKSILARG